MKRMVYADNAATTQLDMDAFEAMKPFFLTNYGNASQPYSFARAVKKALKQSRETIAECIGASSEEIYFTSGGTESDNWAIKGSAFVDSQKNATITSSIEHHAVLRSCEAIERLGYPVAYLGVTNEGVITPDSLRDIISDKTRLVSIMTVNNEIGSIQPIKELAEISHCHGALFHTDAVQAVGHIPLDVKALGVDILSASAHKFYGPKGIGFSYIRKGIQIGRYADGGSQENSLRAGTENIAGIVGMAVALKNSCKAIASEMDRLAALRTTLIERLSQAHIDFIINGGSLVYPGTISLSFSNTTGEMLLHRLDLKGISVSTGSACDSVHTQLSHVIDAINVPPKYALGTIRVSFGKHNTSEDAIAIADAIIGILNK